MKKKELKLIKVTKDTTMICDLKYIVLRQTNAKLLSMEVHRLCEKFVKDIKNIPLSEELQ